MFSVLKRKCVKIDLKVGVGKMKIKTLYVYLFICSFNNRPGSVISELHQGIINIFVQFRFKCSSSKLRQAFEEEKTQKDQKSIHNSLDEGKNTFFL